MLSRTDSHQFASVAVPTAAGSRTQVSVPLSLPGGLPLGAEDTCCMEAQSRRAPVSERCAWHYRSPKTQNAASTKPTAFAL